MPLKGIIDCLMSRRKTRRTRMVKYDNALIDNQVEFCKMEDLTHYSLAELPIRFVIGYPQYSLNYAVTT